MRSRWAVVLYTDPPDCTPVLDYMFDEKNEKDLVVLIAVFQRLSRVGLDLVDTKMAKHIDGPLYELRKDRHRIMFAEDRSLSCFVLLSAFLKNSQQTPPEEIKKAYQYWNDYLNSGNFQVFKFPVEEF